MFGDEGSSTARSRHSHLVLRMICSMLLHIIYTETAMFLSKKTYPSWRDIQDEFTDYKASFGPWETDVVTEYLQDDYPDLMPSTAAQVAEIVQSDSVLLQLSFLASD